MIKARVKTAKNLSSDYPRLMESIHGNSIVLFTEDRVGTILSEGNTIFTIGEVCNCWDMSAFKEFKGELTLTNK